ncbi:hypothetical protein ACJJJB_00110 (plasmid) [Microbulbifer sp. ANSA001]|uniref:hypothetical protein n=1 Tax=Microbulbifer sp. ANSA001 TaxID=3243358 RepID=UPI0040426B81
MYGTTRPSQVLEMARDVCDVLGHGDNNNAVDILLETAAQESWLGEYKDRHAHKLGVGLTQFDQIGFDDVKARTSRKVIELIDQEFGVDISAVELRELAYSPLLSLIFCRLKYRLVPTVIPKALEERAHYWKRHYNTYHPNAKGTPEEYVNNARRFVPRVMQGRRL